MPTAEEAKRYRASWTDEQREHNREWQRQERRKLHQEALDAYGGSQCAACGATEQLEIDHVDGGGDAHRRQFSSGDGWLRALRRNGWPNDPPLQVLCKPCHSEKTSREWKAKPTCRNGHDITRVGRYKSGHCRLCHKEQVARWNAANRDRRLKQMREYYASGRKAAPKRKNAPRRSFELS